VTRILAACSPGEVRIAVLRKDELLDYAIWRPGRTDGVGDVLHGRVTARVPAMAGSFVALDGVEGFLPDSEGGAGLGVGDAVPVRVIRSAQAGKGPRLSARLAPGAVAPTPGEGPLVELARLHSDAAVLCDEPGLAGRLRPTLDGRIALVRRAFDDGVEAAVEDLAQSDVDLANGMRLHIQPTPALVAIDVDAGGTVAARRGKTAAHVAANQAVLPELARQIRLRNLSGAILVDLAGLPARRRAALAPAFHAALADDARPGDVTAAPAGPAAPEAATGIGGRRHAPTLRSVIGELLIYPGAAHLLTLAVVVDLLIGPLPFGARALVLTGWAALLFVHAPLAIRRNHALIRALEARAVDVGRPRG
jgi:hypothetical protein